MGISCRICSGNFDLSPDSIILCKYKEGIVHLGCCVNNCSWNKQPCDNSLGCYDKI
jgi:hypothetical protein